MTSLMTNIMNVIIEFLYAFWIPIDVICMAISVASFILPGTAEDRDNSKLKYKKRIRSIIVCSVAVIFILLSAGVRNAFVVVPEITDQKLSDAKIMLTSAGLNYDLVPDYILTNGASLSDDKVIWASREAGELVYKGDSILLLTESMVVNPGIEEFRGEAECGFEYAGLQSFTVYGLMGQQDKRELPDSSV